MDPMTLIGANVSGVKTTVDHNCTTESSGDNGLSIYNSSSSTIQLISPLTKKPSPPTTVWVAIGGAEWDRAINQIRTMTEAVVAAAKKGKSVGSNYTIKLHSKK
jgi:hypothetical protein